MKTIKPLVLDDDAREKLASQIWKTVTVVPGPPSVRGPCWTAAGWDDGKGFKKVKFRQQPLYKHRAVYECVVGPVPDGMILDHRCRNRACCNPAHLEPVTVVENTKRGNGAWMLHPKNRAFLFGERT